MCRWRGTRSSRPPAGTDATADAVSWPQTAITGISPPTPVSSAIAGSSVPRTVPGCWRGVNSVRGMPKASIRSQAQSRFSGSINWVVEAMVYSVAISPVRK